MDLYEGGVRVPAIVRWPGVTPVGRVTDQPVITMDWTATMVAAAGSRPDPAYALDGEDLSNVLTGKRGTSDRTFCWRTKRQGAVRSGKWKYVREDKKEYLFDLSADEREQADFSEHVPETLVRMRSEFDKWQSEMQKYPTQS
jgi:arylsulfatase A-like enzyme